MFEEEILSDSDISQHFPEREDEQALKDVLAWRPRTGGAGGGVGGGDEGTEGGWLVLWEAGQRNVPCSLLAGWPNNGTDQGQHLNGCCGWSVMQTKMRVLTAAVAAVRVRARRRTKRRRRRERAQRTRRRGLAGAHSSSNNNSLWQRQRMLPPCHRHRRGPLPALQELLPLRPLALL